MRVRALLDPRYHNFPYSFDDAILATEPIIKPDGYKMFQLSGEISGRSGFFQIGVTIESVIDHRVFNLINVINEIPCYRCRIEWYRN